jgi:hypothetical protein
VPPAALRAVGVIATALAVAGCGSGRPTCRGAWNAAANRTNQALLARAFPRGADVEISTFAQSPGGAGGATGTTEGCSYLAVGGGRYVTISAPWHGDALDWGVTGLDGRGAWTAAQAAGFHSTAALARDGRLQDR